MFLKSVLIYFGRLQLRFLLPFRLNSVLGLLIIV
jgi:hypothetical protein